MLEITTLVLGPASTNCYLVADSSSGEMVVIDPAWDGQFILETAKKRNWKIGHLWYTHAHFDHFGAAAEISEALNPPPVVALHADDRYLWNSGGGAHLFGLNVESGPEPEINLTQGQILHLGDHLFEVRHTPGHTPGHCVFYCAQEKVLFSGDLIFHASVGRTDLPGGDWEALVESIRTQVFSLPDETTILPGHGDATSVGEEKRGNPFVGT